MLVPLCISVFGRNERGQKRGVGGGMEEIKMIDILITDHNEKQWLRVGGEAKVLIRFLAVQTLGVMPQLKYDLKSSFHKSYICCFFEGGVGGNHQLSQNPSSSVRRGCMCAF